MILHIIWNISNLLSVLLSIESPPLSPPPVHDTYMEKCTLVFFHRSLLWGRSFFKTGFWLPGSVERQSVGSALEVGVIILQRVGNLSIVFALFDHGGLGGTHGSPWKDNSAACLILLLFENEASLWFVLDVIDDNSEINKYRHFKIYRVQLVSRILLGRLFRSEAPLLIFVSGLLPLVLATRWIMWLARSLFCCA